MILYGSGDDEIRFSYVAERGEYHWRSSFEGLVPMLERRYRETENPEHRAELEAYMSAEPCPECKGRRLETRGARGPRRRPRHRRGGFGHDRRIGRVLRGPAPDGARARDRREDPQGGQRPARLPGQRRASATSSLSRAAASLSGGESQRIRLATQIGSKLTGVLYVLDEPSIGLHQRDNRKLIDTLLSMRDLGNTVLVVEHDEETIRSADWVLDLGPGAGVHGGRARRGGAPGGARASSRNRSRRSTCRASSRSRRRRCGAPDPARRSSSAARRSTT